MTPQTVLISSDFQEHKGKYYSNKNHLNTYTTVYRSYCTTYNTDKIPSVKEVIGKRLFNQIKKDRLLYWDIMDYIEIWKDSPYMLNQLRKATSKEQIEDVVRWY